MDLGISSFPVSVHIKEEVLSDSEEIYCSICHKCFASEVALRNHARMEHVEAYASGDPAMWTKPQRPGDRAAKLSKKKTKITQEVISTLSHTDLTSLASTDVSYIIVKSEDLLASKIVKSPKKAPTKKPREVMAISGPFECVEPSPLGADGVCHQMFFSCCEYSLHARTEHARRRRAPRCQVCERTLPARQPDADGGLAYACESCGASFSTDVELETHMSKAHVKEKPYACGLCHKRFTQQGGVLQHMRMHTGERPFQCTLCNKAFTQKSGLDQHMRTHTKHKPYRCVVCSKTFIQSVHLKQHMRTHTNVAPFQCGICDKRFKQSSHLNYHLKNHNPASMTTEQREKYEQLVGQIASAIGEHADEHADMNQVFTGGEVEVEIQESGQESYIIEPADEHVLSYQQ